MHAVLASASKNGVTEGAGSGAKRGPRRVYCSAMSLTLRLLGTSASRPTIERNVASLSVVREGETLLFDAAKGRSGR